MTAETLLPYIDLNQELELPFIEELSSPLHQDSILNRDRAVKPDEVDFLQGYGLSVSIAATPALETVLKDFRAFMTHCVEVDENAGSAYMFQLSLDDTDDLVEAYTIQVEATGCKIVAPTVDGIRRALIYLEDEMSLRQYPALALGSISRRAAIHRRISRSPYASYRFGTGWELDKEEDAYPEEYLNRLAHCGVNGIWVAGIYRELIASKIFPEMTVDKTKLGLLARLVEKASRYGIKVYLFVIEPRIQDDRDPVFVNHPEIKGSKWGNYGRTLCTSHPMVLEYIEDATAEIFRSAPGLGGLINLFRGERTSACCSPPPTNRPAGYVQPCPRCAEKEIWEVYCTELESFYKGMRSVSADAEMIAWCYGHNQVELNCEILEHLHPDIHFLDTFEHDGKKEICGKLRTINEYSLSYIGPSEPFKNLNEVSKTFNTKLYAKLQLGMTFETPSMPYVPVPTSAYRKFIHLQELGITGVMQSWIIGGYPSIMHKAAGEASFLPQLEEPEFLHRLAAVEWGEDHAENMVQVWNHFYAGYDKYPFFNMVFLAGPIAKSPAYHLYLTPQEGVSKPYNWGIQRDRVRQPYEDRQEKWLGGFTPDELMDSYRAMAYEWEKGLELFREVVGRRANLDIANKSLAVAEALWIQFRSCANVIEFYKLRDALPAMDKLQIHSTCLRMKELAQNDMALAEAMKPFIEIEPIIGFQSEMQCYSFSKKLIDEKIVQVRGMLVKLDETYDL